MKKELKKTKKIFGLFLFLTFFLADFSFCRAEMSTSNYKIDSDAIGSFGNSSNSAGYQLGDTGGEVGTGNASSANFGLSAGFWQSSKDEPVLSLDITDDSVDLGILDSSQAHFGIATFNVTTNAERGYVIEYFGSTLNFESNTINPMSTLATSSPGMEQFGFNLVANGSLPAGADPSGGHGQAESGYNTANSFKFNPGDVIASSDKAGKPTYYTMTFVGNIDQMTDSGSYYSNISILATGKY